MAASEPVPDPGAVPGDSILPAVAPGPAPSSHRRARGFGIAVLLIGSVGLIGVLASQGTQRAAGPVASSAAGGRESHPAPRMAVIDDHGSLAVRDLAGRTAVLDADPGAAFGFPAWSPDGTRIAVVADRTEATTVEVVRVPPDALTVAPSGSAGPPSELPPGASTETASGPVVAFRSAASRPFYLYWSPDGQRISFLSSETDGLSLRVAPADGSDPGDDGAGLVRRGSPLYFDWVSADRLLLHVGAGSSAFVGEVGTDGSSPGPAIDGSGDFRPAVATADGRYLAFVRGPAGAERLIAARRDGSNEHDLALLGPAALVFDPTGTTLAIIAADRPDRSALSFPIGPLRLLDPETGSVRTLFDGDIVGFFWAPDGRTIAVLRLQGPTGSTVAENPIVAAIALGPAAPAPALAVGGDGAFTAVASGDPAAIGSGGPAPTPGATPGSELHLLFVNVADGAVRSDRVVQLTTPYVNQILPYFDQYALSHRTWSSDSRAIVLPLLDGGGSTHLVVLPADGSQPVDLPGSSGFWSP